MGTTHAELFAALAAPFSAQEVRVRDAPGGRKLSYITPALALIRLDEVAGPENVRITYREVESRRPDGPAGVVCTIAIRIEGEWVERSDAGGYTVMKDKAGNVDHENTIKTAYSDALKRAASAWGVGRYLRNDGTADFGPTETTSGADQPAHAGSPAPRSDDRDQVPRSGKELYGWCLDVEKSYNLAMLKYLNGWGKLQEFPYRIVDWDEAQAAQGYAAAKRKLDEVLKPTATDGPSPDDPAAKVQALKKIVRNIARQVHGRQDVTAEECIRALVRLDALVPESLRIADLNTCTDEARLSAYLDAALKRHDALLAAAAGTGDAA